MLCLYGTYNCDALMDKFRSANSTAKHTLVLLDFALNIEERRRLARKIKEEKSFSKTFIVIVICAFCVNDKAEVNSGHSLNSECHMLSSIHQSNSISSPPPIKSNSSSPLKLSRSLSNGFIFISRICLF